MDTETRYNLALDYLYSFIDYSLKKSAQIAAANFDLGRMRRFLQLLGDPQNAYPAIHVAGTKGKGSVSALCAAALQASGRKTGLYTSPHLLDFAERIQVDGIPIPHETLADLVEEIKPAVEQVPELTTFELTTALGFLYFARQQVDAAVIEVGLGGRLDATNVFTPRAAVITSLSYDHMALLGDTLAKIAFEKAGIIKPGAPVVSAPQKPEALEVLEQTSAARGCEFSLVGRDVRFEAVSHSLDGQVFTLQSAPFDRPPLHFEMTLLGAHQVSNAATAFLALQQSGLELSNEHIAQGFAQAQWPCRFEVASRQDPLLVFDSAHNVDSFERLSEAIEDYFPGQKVVLLFGISEDKHLREMLLAIQSKVEILIATRANHPRALEPGRIVETAKEAGARAEAVDNPELALARAIEIAQGAGRPILSAGSMFATAELKAAWLKKQNQEKGIHA
jgi:dihydrofolate synthase/folylpolyglutamate synthase